MRSRRRRTAASTSATSPDGKIYKVDRQRGATTFFEPGESTSGRWRRTPRAALRRDRRQGHGLQDLARRQGRQVLSGAGDNVTSLAFDRSGNLLVGTESPGRVLRSTLKEKASSCSTPRSRRSASLRFDDKGMLYAAAVSGRGGPVGAPADERTIGPPAVRAIGRTGRVGHDRDDLDCRRRCSGGGSAAATPREDRRARSGAVYRIAPDGLWDKLWQSREDSPYDIVFDARRQADIAHRQPRQAVPPGGRPAAADVRHQRRRPSRSRRSTGTRAVSMLLRDRQPRQGVPAVGMQRAPRGTYESDPRDAQVAFLGRDQLAWVDAGRQPRRNLHPLGKHADARRHMERVVVRRTQHRKGRRSSAPRPGTCSGVRCSPARATRRC